MAWRTSQGHGDLGGNLALLGLLALAGPLTALPLLLFASGARRIPLATLGVLQYIGPTIQFALGVCESLYACLARAPAGAVHASLVMSRRHFLMKAALGVSRASG